MNKPYTPIKVILADDHEIFRDGFAGLLKNQAEFILVGEASNGQQLVDLTKKMLPDVILTDIQMPVMDGIEATKIITARYPQVGIIALSAFNNDMLIIDMLKAGALGYLLKSAQKKEVIEAINTVSRHRPYYCSDTNIKLARLIAISSFDPANPGIIHALSEKEKDIVCLICQEYSNKEIAIKLNLGKRTVESYRERILDKTGCKSTAGLIIYAIKNHIYDPG